MSLRTALFPLLAGALLATNAQAARYQFDTVHSQIIFFASHLGFSISEGEFLEFDGGFDFDPDNWSQSRLNVIIDANSIDMDNEKWDKHMKSADFFHVEKYPEITFKSRKVEGQGKTGKIHGDLTILGVTKPVTLDVTLHKIGTHPFTKKTTAGFSATTQVKRSAFGMTYGLPGVGDEIDLRIEVEAFQD